MKMGTMPKFSNFMKLEKDMTNMFKKTLIAAALAGFGASASAAVLNSTPQWTANEYVQTSEVLVYGAGLTLTVGANYAENDLIRLTFTGTSIDVDTLNDVVAIGGNANLNLLSTEVVDGNTVALYRVTDVTGNTNGTTTADFFDVDDGAEFDATKVSGNFLNVAFSAETFGGLPLDTSGTAAQRTVALFGFANQLSVLEATTKFDGVIDVAPPSERTLFEGAVDADAASIAVSNSLPAAVPNFAAGLSATVIKADYTLEGNFGWALDEDGDLIAGAVLPECVVATSAVVVTATKATWTCTGADINANPEFSVENMEIAAIPTTTFAGSAVITYEGADDEATKTLTFDAGRWTLNGAEINIPYMPYQSNITHVINVNNAGGQTGDITVEGFDRTGKEYGPVVVGVSEAGTQTAIAGAIEAALKAEGMPASERLSLKIIVNVPQDDVTVYSAYNVSGTGARLVVNDSNGKD
jgi:hypothetical protein